MFIENNMYISPIIYLAISVAFIFVGTLVFKRDIKKTSNIFFFLSTFAVGIWGIVFAAHLGDYSLAKSESFNAVLPYFMSVNIPLMFLFFGLTFTQQKFRVTKKVLVLIFTPYTILIWGIFFFSSQILKINPTEGSLKLFYFFYFTYILVYIFVVFLLLLKRYRASAGVFKAILRSIVIIDGLGSSLVFCAMFLYVLKGGNDYVIFWGYVIVFVSFLLIGIKKMQYHRWNIKSFFVELFVSFVAIILVAQMFFKSYAGNLFVDFVVLIFFLISGYSLVRSVSREMKVKDEIEKLVKDLTDVNEELQMLDKRKSEFVKISAHHLKTPLTVIKGYASMILEGSFGKDMDNEAEESTKKIFEASERLVNIIKDFMDISNIESGKMEYVFEEINFKKLVEGVLEEMKLTVDRSGLDVSFNTDEIDGYIIEKADAGKLRQVVSNLVDNSIKYTPHGHVHLFLKKDESSKKILLTITDTGVGMSKETINKLFEKFSRADDANKVNTGGSGLGLYVAKEIMKKHEANIWVESPGEGKGSTFHLEFNIK